MPTEDESKGTSFRRSVADASAGSKPARLARSTDFERAYRGGQAHSHSLLRVHVVTSPQAQAQCRSGFVAGRRVGSAVDRNRAKRLMREAWRDLRSSVAPGHDIIFVAHRPLAGASKAEAAGAMEKLLRRAGLAGGP